MKRKAYRVVPSPLTREIDDVAEDIVDLANSIRGRKSNKVGLIHDADAIMHLAADLKMDAEQALNPKVNPR